MYSFHTRRYFYLSILYSWLFYLNSAATTRYNEEALCAVHTSVCRMTNRADGFSTTQTYTHTQVVMFMCACHSCPWLLNITYAQRKQKRRKTERVKDRKRKMESSHKKNAEWIYDFDCECAVLCVFVAIVALWSIDLRRRAIIHLNSA